MDPKNPPCKFHKASVYFSPENNQAKYLEEFKENVPKESVYFQIHKNMGNTHLTHEYLWATDLDACNANTQIKVAIDKQYTNENEETRGTDEQTADDRASVSSGTNHQSSHDSSSVDPVADDLRLQAMKTSYKAQIVKTNRAINVIVN